MVSRSVSSSDDLDEQLLSAGVLSADLRRLLNWKRILIVGDDA